MCRPESVHHIKVKDQLSLADYMIDHISTEDTAGETIGPWTPTAFLAASNAAFVKRR